MKRHLVPLLLAAAAASVQAEWLTMIGDPRDAAANIVQVDPASLTSSDGRKTMRIRVSRSNQRTSWDGIAYRSYEAKVLFDCERQTARYLQISYYPGPAWRGEVLQAVNYPADPPRWMQFREVQPNPNERIIQAACARSRVSNVNPAAAEPAPRHAIPAAQVRRALEERFPVRREVSGVVELELTVPRLRFLAAQNRLGAELAMTAAGPALPRPHAGRVDLDFALRYEPADRSVRAHQVRVNAVRFEGLSADATALLEGYVRRYASQTLQEFVVHRLRPEDLALPDTMGLEPGSITVGVDRLLIGFVPKGKR